MKAKDLMIPLQEYLTPETSLKEAANRLGTAPFFKRLGCR